MKKICFKLTFCFLYLVFACKANAQDLLSGEISTIYVSAYTYEATVTIYAKDTAINRDSIVIDWGDGGIDTLLKDTETISNDLRVLIYKGTHTYPIDGVYSIFYSGNYRIPGIVNVPSSESTPLQLEHTLLVTSVLNNSAVKFLSPSFDVGISNEAYYYWPGANEPDGDSLTYSLQLPFGSGWFIPTGMSINAVTGDFLWDTPSQEGYFGIGIEVREWRNSIVISTTQREMLIKIESFTGNTLTHNASLLEITIYPNPTAGLITVIGLAEEPARITVYNILGEPVHSQELNRSGKQVIDLSTLPGGLYLIQLQYGQMILRKKIIKQ